MSHHSIRRSRWHSNRWHSNSRRHSSRWIRLGISWTCSCGSVNTSKFCPNCGQPKPESAAPKFCPNCGQSFPDPANPPKFCPNCGTKIG